MVWRRCGQQACFSHAWPFPHGPAAFRSLPSPHLHPTMCISQSPVMKPQTASPELYFNPTRTALTSSPPVR